MERDKEKHTFLVEKDSVKTNYDKQITLPIKYDINTICNICSGRDKLFVSLFKEEEGYSLRDIFASLTSIEIPYNHQFKVCSECHKNAIFCYQFKEQCYQAFSALHNSAGDGIKKDESILILELDETAPSLKSDTVSLQFDNQDNIKKEEPNFSHDNVEYLDDNLLNSNENENQDDDQLLIEKGELLKVKRKSRVKIFNWCKICDKRFVSIENLKAHEKIHKPNNKLISCRYCREKFANEHDLKVHSTLHVYGKKWTCPQCNKEFHDRTPFRRHLRRHYKTKLFACATCDKEFAELCALRRHERVHTGEIKEYKQQCTFCDKRFPSKYLLKIHTAVHTGIRPCTCGTCGKSFASSRLLKSHELTHTDEKPFQCDICNNKFRHNSTLKSHMRMHTGEKPFICSVCGKSFRQNSNLTLHMRSHSGEKPYPCKSCARKFSSTSSLSAHMLTHCSDKRVPCKVCGKLYQKRSLVNHMRLHAGEGDHKCPVCPKRYVTGSRLRVHLKSHSEKSLGKPFECNYCGNKFKKESSLTNHLKKHETNDIVVSRKIKPLNTKEKNAEVKTKDGEILHITEVPVAVSEELVLHDDNSVKTELIVIEEGIVSPMDGLTLQLYHVNGRVIQHDVN